MSVGSKTKGRWGEPVPARKQLSDWSETDETKSKSKSKGHRTYEVQTNSKLRVAGGSTSEGAAIPGSYAGGPCGALTRDRTAPRPKGGNVRGSDPGRDGNGRPKTAPKQPLRFSLSRRKDRGERVAYETGSAAIAVPPASVRQGP